MTREWQILKCDSLSRVGQMQVTGGTSNTSRYLMIIMTHEINEFFMNHSLSFMLKMKEDVKLKLFWLIFDYVITHR